jgi:hypothetical protein
MRPAYILFFANITFCNDKSFNALVRLYGISAFVCCKYYLQF